MNSTAPPLILLTNDDGVFSPGLQAAAEALDPLGEVLIVAPREQQSGTGRSMPSNADGRIVEESITINGREIPTYAVRATPALLVQHGILELATHPPALVVSGINYGENVAQDVTVSGTVGAALEAAAFGIPSMAVSLQTDITHHLTHERSVDFSAAAHFTQLFAARMLAWEGMSDVDVLKIDVPINATPATPWRVTRLALGRYFEPVAPERSGQNDETPMGYRFAPRSDDLDPRTDVGALLSGWVSVTPLSLDLTSRVDLATLQQILSEGRPR
jgi:5'-nucleotidase